jgi:hypothetical protein
LDHSKPRPFLLLFYYSATIAYLQKWCIIEPILSLLTLELSEFAAQLLTVYLYMFYLLWKLKSAFLSGEAIVSLLKTIICSSNVLHLDV